MATVTKRRPSMAEVRQEMRCFMESTSLKGAPRIMKSQNCCMRVFWIVIVICLMLTTVFFTTMLILEYLQYNAVINMEEYIMLSRSDREELEKIYHFTFPSVTVCNQSPFRSDYTDFLPGGVLSHNVFTNMATAQMHHVTVPDAVWQDFSAYGYLTYLAETTYQYHYSHTVLGQTFDDFFISCYFISDDNTDNEDLSCRRVGIVNMRLLPFSVTCFQIEFLDQSRVKRNSVTGLSMILYLDNFSDFIPVHFFDYANDFRKQTGVHVITHLSGTNPQIYDAHSKFSPGLNVALTVSAKATLRLPQPYSLCDDTGRSLYYIDGMRNSYSQQGCIMACEQDLINADCNCVYPPKYMYFKRDLGMRLLGQMPFCHSLREGNISITFDQIHCAQDTIFRYEQHCVNKCKPNCTEIQFSHSSTASQWPAKNTQLAFYNTAVATPAANSTRHEKFAPTYEPINEAVANGNATEALRLLKSTSLIDDNFVKVTISLDQNNLLAFESKPMMNTSKFTSMLGGTLNLYAGITFVFLFELVELGIKICHNAANKFKSRNQITQVQVTTRCGRTVLQPHAS